MWNTGGMEAIIWTAFWICAGLGAIGTVVAGVTLIRTGGDNYQK